MCKPSSRCLVETWRPSSRAPWCCPRLQRRWTPVTTQVHCLRGNEAVGRFTPTQCVQLIWGAKYVACRTWLCVHQAVCYHLHPAEAWDLATVNRLDLNVLADYRWPRFRAQANAFVAQVRGRGGRAGAGS